MFDDEYQGPELHVPAEALRKPQGATIADDGTVACVGCGTRIPLAKADIVGQGYRCPRCTAQAHVAALERGTNVDAGAHLSRAARDDLRETARNMMFGGGALIVLGVLLCILFFDTSGMKLAVAVIGLGVALAITGSMKREAAG